MIFILSDHIGTPIGRLVLLARDGVLISLEFDDLPERIARGLEARFGECARVPVGTIPSGFRTGFAPISAASFRQSRTSRRMAAARNFRRRVWAELRRIPCGSSHVLWRDRRTARRPECHARRRPRQGRNPVAVVVPCHRVIGADGTRPAMAAASTARNGCSPTRARAMAGRAAGRSSSLMGFSAHGQATT